MSSFIPVFTKTGLKMQCSGQHFNSIPRGPILLLNVFYYMNIRITHLSEKRTAESRGMKCLMLQWLVFIRLQEAHFVVNSLKEVAAMQL
jgi:hypothetical protein